MGDNPVSLVDPLGLEDGEPKPRPGEVRYDVTGRGFAFVIDEYVPGGGWIEFLYDWSLYDNVSNSFERAWMMADLVYDNNGKYRLAGEAYNQQHYRENNRNINLATQNSGYNSKLLGSANQGGGWLNTTSNVSSAAGVGGAVKSELIEYAIRSNYKSATTRVEFSKLRRTQQAWRTTNTLGKTGASYLKFTKGLGIAGNVIGITSAGVQLIDNPTIGNATRLAVQGAAIGAAFIPVVGWGVSLGIGSADLLWGDDFYNWIDRP